jgi:glycosyltransferase involved in cell wall biosynthesis
VPSWTREFTPPPPERAPDAPFLFVGTLEPRKNLSGLLLAYRSFLTECDAENRQCPQLILVGGRGWKDSGLHDLLRPLIAADRVTVLDYCGPAQLWRQYGLARALLFPSLHEGFGFPILEAMVAGLPVMTSDRGAMAEVAGEAALLLNPLDQEALVAGMRRLTTDGDFRRELAARGQRRWQLWSWEETARTTVETYRQVLDPSA